MQYTFAHMFSQNLQKASHIPTNLSKFDHLWFNYGNKDKIFNETFIGSKVGVIYME